MNPIKVDPEIMGGTPCFAGTRVPVKTLFDLLEKGRSLDYFPIETFHTSNTSPRCRSRLSSTNVIPP